MPREAKNREIVAKEVSEEDKIFDQTPVPVTCPHCGLNVITYIEHESSWVTYTAAVLLFLTLGWAALCVVPVVYPLFKDVVHHCPRCLSVLATRSRMALPSWRDDIMSFRFGSCVVVLARKYVLLLLAITCVVGGIHFVRTSGPSSSALAHATRGEVSPLDWADFNKDCGFKSYLGNPIHVTMAFQDKYKNHTFRWTGTVHHADEGFSFFWMAQRGALFVRMEPSQFPTKGQMSDLVLTFDDASNVGKEAVKLKRGQQFGFEATMFEVGRRGAPHSMVLWDVFEPGATGGSSRAEKVAGGGKRGTNSSDVDV